MAKLTDKQKLFVKEYLVDLNATQAALRSGYSKKTAAFIGAENLKKPQIAHEVQKAADRRSKRTEITADNVLNGIAEIAFNTEVKESDRLRGFELLGKHLVLFTEKFQGDLKLYGKIQREIVKADRSE